MDRWPLTEEELQPTGLIWVKVQPTNGHRIHRPVHEDGNGQYVRLHGRKFRLSGACSMEGKTPVFYE